MTTTFTFESGATIAAALTRAMETGARVTVHLTSGKDLTGKVGSVGNGHAVIQSLMHREFFDAVVAVDHIEAMEAQTRTA